MMAVILVTPATPATLVTLDAVRLDADPALLHLVLATIRLAVNVKTAERGIMIVTTVAALGVPMFVTEI